MYGPLGWAMPWHARGGYVHHLHAKGWSKEEPTGVAAELRIMGGCGHWEGDRNKGHKGC